MRNILAGLVVGAFVGVFVVAFELAIMLWRVPEPQGAVEREPTVLREVVVRLSVAPPDKARTVYTCSPEVRHRRK